jgi:hypothetical protein
MNKNEIKPGDFWGQLGTKIVWMDVETCGLGQNDHDTKHAN